jgi:cytochrome c oxidase assembly factor CtaG
MRACTRRIASASVDTKPTSLDADRVEPAAWCRHAPHARRSPTDHLMFEPPLLGVVVAAGLFHLGGRWGSGRRRRRDRLRAVWFYSGLATLLVAIDSPLDGLADRSFAAHMTQHVLLLTVAPPLLVAAAPWARLWRPLPLGFRRAVARFVVRDPRARLLRAAGRGLWRPAVVWVAFDANLVVWHLPALYDATLRSQTVHDAEHLLFLGTGLALWAQVLDSPPLRSRLGDLQRAGYLALATLVGWALAVVLAFAPHPLYTPYASLAHRPGGLSALADQQIAAGVMWVPGSLAFSIAIVVFLLRLTAADAPRTRRPAPLPLAPVDHEVTA